MSKSIQNNNFLGQIADLLQSARLQVMRTVNQTMVYTYFEIGRMIVEEEQNGKDRAEYGKQLLKNLSNHLTEQFGKGFSVDNLQNMRKLYFTYSISETLSRKLEDTNQKYETVSSISKDSIPQSLSAISTNEDKIPKLVLNFHLTWSHYCFLISIDDSKERKFYEIESTKYQWSLRELKCQYNSALYTRLSLSRDKEGILKLSEKGQVIEKPKDIIKDPYILEFLGLPELHHYSESELEKEIINKLEHFLLELGHGFTFVA